MTIETSPEHKAEIESRRKFERLTVAIQTLTGEVQTVLTAAHAMKMNLSTATLTLAEIEALYVNQTHAKRDADAKLHETTTRLTDLMETVKTSTDNARALLERNGTAVTSLLTQANRVAHEPFILDLECGVVENVEYVDIDWIAEQLEVSKKQVRRYIEFGKFPAHSALAVAEGGRPRQMWLKSAATNAIAEQKAAASKSHNKKGISALV